MFNDCYDNSPQSDGFQLRHSKCLEASFYGRLDDFHIRNVSLKSEQIVRRDIESIGHGDQFYKLTDRLAALHLSDSVLCNSKSIG